METKEKEEKKIKSEKRKKREKSRERSVLSTKSYKYHVFIREKR